MDCKNEVSHYFGLQLTSFGALGLRIVVNDADGVFVLMAGLSSPKNLDAAKGGGSRRYIPGACVRDEGQGSPGAFHLRLAWRLLVGVGRGASGGVST